MSFNELINIFLRIRDSIYFYLNFFFVGVVALIGWKLSIVSELEISEKVITTSLFTIFWLICLISLKLQYSLLVATQRWIESINDEDIKKYQLYLILVKHPYNWSKFTVILIFSLIYLVTFVVIWGIMI